MQLFNVQLLGKVFILLMFVAFFINQTELNVNKTISIKQATLLKSILTLFS